ncbi:hypothetical protein TCAL_14629 [Tigriopus californicus]|uniref:IRS-type PTB domain-containing protein n=1 Tax=Tigriopus californicus TaxID=6832 RepID=A0A553P8B1_TIGCA|nr:uncharacterized protein LOC131877437 [Tigriopus californicus]XP_059079084.1 uncharacterized protein LOC131877437 [Tigriopus californicus]XP_059079086.1 uncharacterized protein LOC131877437 [Tigriopus californicus]TRY73922.1 hypothetical protein TCAL_14629 [Tigriopus californicus]
MGCVSSRPDINDTHRDVFTVKSLDEHGNELHEGQIKITDTTVTFYVKGHEPMEWPLRSIRRYGAENDMFCFESGRRCQTGPKFCAFKCQKADSLLKLLQTYVRSTSRGGTSRNTTNRGSVPEHSGSDSNPELLNRQQSVDSLQPSTLARNTSTMATSSTTNTLNQMTNRSRLASLEMVEILPEYANVNCNGGTIVLDADGHPVPTTPGGPTGTLTSQSREYENVGIAEAARSPCHTVSLNGMTQSTSIIDSLPGYHMPKRSPGGPKSAPLNGVFFPHSQSTSNGFLGGVEDPYDQSKQINYIDVEFDHTIAPSPVSNGNGIPVPNGLVLKHSTLDGAGTSESNYSKIDIDRTVALSKTATQQTQRALDPSTSDSPIGVRKTRHNSTLSELNSNLVEGIGGFVSRKRNSVIEDQKA